MTDTAGWDSSADAWIASMGEHGDKGRRYVLDEPMLVQVRDSGARTALDVGCGEGRFCRMLRAMGVSVTGLDPTPALLEAAKQRDPEGDYQIGRSEDLPFADESFDLVVSYLSLIDIEDFESAISEMTRVLKPAGTLLIANLAPHATALPRNWPEGAPGWVMEEDGSRKYYAMDDYLRSRSYWTAWAGIRIVNYHRPLSAYMSALLSTGLRLKTYDEPPYIGPDEAITEKYMRVPWFCLMAWVRDE